MGGFTVLRAVRGVWDAEDRAVALPTGETVAVDPPEEVTDGTHVRWFVSALLGPTGAVQRIVGFTSRLDRNMFEWIVAAVRGAGPAMALRLVREHGAKHLMNVLASGNEERVRRELRVPAGVAGNMVRAKKPGWFEAAESPDDDLARQLVQAGVDPDRARTVSDRQKDGAGS